MTLTQKLLVVALVGSFPWAHAKCSIPDLNCTAKVSKEGQPMTIQMSTAGEVLSATVREPKRTETFYFTGTVDKKTCTWRLVSTDAEEKLRLVVSNAKQLDVFVYGDGFGGGTEGLTIPCE